MERVVEPELMDEDEQARAYSDANFAEPHERFADLFVASWPSSSRGDIRDVTGPILDLGCGPADVTVRVAKRLPKAVVHGVDGSAAMLRYGHERVARERLEQRVVLKQALLPRDPPPAASYPIVISNSLLHHLHDPTVMWTIVKQFGAKGAHVFIMDLMRPASMKDVDALLDEHAKGEPKVLRDDFHASLCAAFTLDEIKAQLRAAGLSQLTVQAVSDRHLTVAGPL